MTSPILAGTVRFSPFPQVRPLAGYDRIISGFYSARRQGVVLVGVQSFGEGPLWLEGPLDVFDDDLPLITSFAQSHFEPFVDGFGVDGFFRQQPIAGWYAILACKHLAKNHGAVVFLVVSGNGDVSVYDSARRGRPVAKLPSIQRIIATLSRPCSSGDICYNLITRLQLSR